MKNRKTPNPNKVYPIDGYDNEIYVKPTITNPNIMVGNFTYIADSEFEHHVTNFYPWSRDKLIIGKFCQIATGVRIGDGAIIGANSVVGSDVDSYTIVVGNPTRVIRRRFDDELIGLMLEWKWWDYSIEEINQFISILANSNLDMVKEKIKLILSK